MEKIFIDNPSHKDYVIFRELYAVSFPIFEQRTEQQQSQAFLSEQYHLVAFRNKGVFIGFISYWEFQDYIYIEHFAINQNLRGKGYGGQILGMFINESSKIIILEIDPIIDDISAARLKFYKNLKFYENPYPHIHPPYRESYSGHPLIIMTTQRQIAVCEYDRFKNDIVEKIMNTGS